MDDLNEKLTGLLSSPEGMAKIQSVLSALGGPEGLATALPSGTPPSAGVLNPSTPPPASPAGGASGGLPDLTMLTKLLPLLSGAGQETQDTRLLQALRPYLHGEREKRLEETMGLLRLAKLLPLLQAQNGQ